MTPVEFQQLRIQWHDAKKERIALSQLKPSKYVSKSGSRKAKNTRRWRFS